MGGFFPFPNTIATALLAYQSEAIGYGFGIKFQAGKRTIGAMTNEEFNGLTDASLGQLINAHNTELIGRMKAEMPKWISIQKDFIEAHVQVEIAKAQRTPSAMTEIIEALASATTQEIGEKLSCYLDEAIDTEGAITALSIISPIFALIGFIGAKKICSVGEIPPPPSPDEPDPTDSVNRQVNCDRWSVIGNSDGTHSAIDEGFTFVYLGKTNWTCAELQTNVDLLSDRIQNDEPIAKVKGTLTEATAYVNIQQNISCIKELRNNADLITGCII